jgi:hypothetical protein
MNRKLVFVFVVALAILLPVMLAGQEKKGGGGADKKDMAGSNTVTGCLNKGADADHFVIKDDKGKETVVTGDATLLSRHANNHNVTLTGSMAKEGGKDVMKATDLKMNSVCK